MINAADRIARENWTLGPVRARLVNAVMFYAFDSARRCGESIEVAQQEAFAASQWVKEVMRGKL